jgi:F0F1-type ATP synthase assembly protein I
MAWHRGMVRGMLEGLLLGVTFSLAVTSPWPILLFPLIVFFALLAVILNDVLPSA